jgi:hypothetical protein
METPEYLVDRYLSEGYTTVVLTNHINNATFRSKDYFNFLSENSLPDNWNSKMDYYLSDYKKMKEYADGKLNVLLGVELRLIASNVNEYLIYGFTEEWIRNSEAFLTMRVKELSKYVRESNYRIYQAHPFRNDMTVIDPSYVDGYEVYNGNLGHDSRNSIAEAYAKLYDKPGISGTDFHQREKKIRAGIITNEPITDNEKLLDILTNQNYELIKD